VGRAVNTSCRITPKIKMGRFLSSLPTNRRVF